MNDIKTFDRNRYFYGKLLDVHHFESEQKYFNDKRWLTNRLVSGYGVICGLDVNLADDGRSVWVGPGVALDKAGHEIIVPEPSKLVAIPDAPPAQTTAPRNDREEDEEENRRHGHVVICYHECDGGPEPVRAGDCDTPERCVPGSIRERYTVSIKHGKAHRMHPIHVDDLILNGRVNYQALANFVTGNCSKLPDHCCIPLANIELPDAEQKATAESIDITIRPIVFTNDLLYQLLTAFMAHGANRPRPGK